MNLDNTFQNKSTFRRLVLFTLIIFLFLILSGLCVTYLNLDTILPVRFLLVLTSLFTFLFPCILFFRLQNINFYKGLKIDLNLNRHMILLMISIMIFILPFISYMAQINEIIILNLPERFSSIQQNLIELEERMQQTIENFLVMNSIYDLLLSLFLIAIMPAFLEEIVFRGVYQQELSRVFNFHIAIIITSLLFSLIHMQFFGFFPRFFLGMVLGYLFYYSQNLVMPIIAHFLNNAFVILSFYFINTEEILPQEIRWTEAFFSLSIVLMFFYLYIKLSENKFRKS